YGVPLEFFSIDTDEILGTWRFIPLGLFGIWIVLARRTGIRLARAAQLKNLWQPTLGAVAAFEFFVWGTITLVQSETVNLHVTIATRSEEHTSELQSRFDLVCRLL